MRRLECEFANRPRWGEARLPAEEPLRIGQATSLGFHPSEIHGLDRGDGERPDRMRLAFFGVLGAQGPMPLAFSEYVRERERRHNDPTLRAFLDVYQHRLATLLYRAWASGRGATEADRPTQDRLAARLTAAYGGAGGPRCPSPYFAGRMAPGPRAPEGLEAILQGELWVPVRVIEYVGRRLRLERSERLRLMSPTRRGRLSVLGTPARLGQSAVLGRTWFDPQQRFRLRLGPMSWRRYEALLPRPSRYGRRPAPSRLARRLNDATRAYMEPGMSFDARLILRRADVPAARLGHRVARLGHCAWLSARGRRTDAADLLLRPSSHHSNHVHSTQPRP